MNEYLEICRHVTKNRTLDFPFVFLEEMTFKSLIDTARMLQSALYRQEYFHQLSDVSGKLSFIQNTSEFYCGNILCSRAFLFFLFCIDILRNIFSSMTWFNFPYFVVFF